MIGVSGSEGAVTRARAGPTLRSRKGVRNVLTVAEPQTNTVATDGDGPATPCALAVSILAAGGGARRDALGGERTTVIM